jgi:hypothetical protein
MGLRLPFDLGVDPDGHSPLVVVLREHYGSSDDLLGTTPAHLTAQILPVVQDRYDKI